MAHWPPLCLAEIPIIVYLPAFYAQELHLSAAVVGVVFLVARLWDGLSDLLVGGFRTRYSRIKGECEGRLRNVILQKTIPHGAKAEATHKLQYPCCGCTCKIKDGLQFELFGIDSIGWRARYSEHYGVQPQESF